MPDPTESHLLTCERDAQNDARNAQDDGFHRLVSGMRMDERDVPGVDEL
jgi:hypothetical protein